MSLVICPECKQQISSHVKTCPRCGYVVKKNHPILAAIGWLFLICLVLSFCSIKEDKNLNTNTGNNNTDSRANAPKQGIKVLEDGWCRSEYGSRYVCGVVYNGTGKTYSYAHIEINLYDSTGAQIGSTLDNINNLEPGGKWKFKAYVTEDEATSYKIKDLTYF